MAKFDERGREILDDKPAALPVGFQRPPSLQDQIRSLVRNELSRRASDQGFETFEESDDFEVGDDFDPKSPWELRADQEHYVHPPEAPSPKDADEGSGGEDLGGSAKAPSEKQAKPSSKRTASGKVKPAPLADDDEAAQ